MNQDTKQQLDKLNVSKHQNKIRQDATEEVKRAKNEAIRDRNSK